jgi:hypothetical protein
MESIIKYVVGEMRVIAEAPATFVVALLVLAGAVWWLLDWKYSSVVASRDAIIGNRDSEIALLKGQRDDYKDKLSGATPDQAKAHIVALEARLARVEGRRLSDVQKKNLVDQLRSSHGTIMVSMDMNCADCGQYGSDFARAFRDAGWEVIESRVQMPSNRPASSLGLRVPDIKNPSSESQRLINFLQGNNIRFDLQQSVARPLPGFPIVAMELLVVAL